MPYLLIEDGFADNPKITALSDKAFRLHMSALVYCARNLTDGAISEIALRSSALNSKIGRPNSVVKDLVSAGLWLPNGDGWMIHDYLKHNPTRAEIEGKRQLARERKRRQRVNGHAGQSRGTGRGSHATQDPPQEPLRGSLVTSSPAGSSHHAAATTEAAHLAATWKTPDSDAFAERLDEIERTHHTSFRAIEREHLWDTASANLNGHAKTAPPLPVRPPAFAGHTSEPPPPPSPGDAP